MRCSTYNPKLLEINNYIIENYHKSSFNVDKLHYLTNISYSYTRTLIKDEYNCSPQRLLEIIRVGVAIRLLSENIEIRVLHERIGYACPRTMRDAFHRRINNSPKVCQLFLLHSKNKIDAINQFYHSICKNGNVFVLLQIIVNQKVMYGDTVEIVR